MKRAIASVFLAVQSVNPVHAADVELEVTNITEQRGAIYWALFDNAEAYSTDGAPVVSSQNKVLGETLRITLHDLPEGRYAVRLFHDANANGEMDSNVLGIPVEGYGFSNNAGKFGPAGFEDAAVTVTQSVKIDIRLR